MQRHRDKFVGLTEFSKQLVADATNSWRHKERGF
jgi:hypothetical protein